MKNIGIIGTGQAGLQLGFELLAKGYDITIFTDKSPKEILDSAIFPAPIQFYPSLVLEEKHRLNFWAKERDAQLDASCFSSYDPQGKKLLTIKAPLYVKAKSIDLRLKYAVWLEEFVRRGGNMVIQKMNIDMLEDCTLKYDAVFVATGRDRLNTIFERNEELSLYKAPQRNFLFLYLTNCQFTHPHHPDWNTFYFFSTPGVGEFLLFNSLHKSGKKAYSFLIEAVPNGPLDLFNKRMDGSAQMEILKEYAKRNHSDLYEIIKDTILINNEYQYGAVIPEVKMPAGKLPSGRVVMAIGDALMTYDPIAAQGLNAASKSAHYIAECIAESTGDKFDERWINDVFDGYWEKAEYNVLYENSFLNASQRHQKIISVAASRVPAIASDWVNGMGEPSSLAPFYFDSSETPGYLKENGFSSMQS
jgi:hypothetical protein